MLMENFNKEDYMNVGEKICLYKERLNFRDYQEFGRAVGISGNWINETSKKSEIKQINDLGYLVKLCGFLGITIDEFLKDDKIETDELNEIDIVDVNSEDIGVLINNMIVLLGRDGIKIDGMLMSDKSKEICVDSLAVVKTLVKQHL